MQIIKMWFDGKSLNGKPEEQRKKLPLAMTMSHWSSNPPEETISLDEVTFDGTDNFEFYSSRCCFEMPIKRLQNIGMCHVLRREDHICLRLRMNREVGSNHQKCMTESVKIFQDSWIRIVWNTSFWHKSNWIYKQATLNAGYFSNPHANVFEATTPEKEIAFLQPFLTGKSKNKSK